MMYLTKNGSRAVGSEPSTSSEEVFEALRQCTLRSQAEQQGKWLKGDANQGHDV